MSTSIFKKSVADFYILIIFVVLSVTNIALDIKYSNSNYIRILINDLLINPIQYIVETPSNFFDQMMEERQNISELNKKIEFLEKHFDKYPKAYLYHYNDYEKRALRELASDYSATFIKGNNFVDKLLRLETTLKEKIIGQSQKNKN